MQPTIVVVHGAFAESASWDRIIPAALQRYMAERAQAQRTVAVEGASHAILVSRPDATVHPILEAAAIRVAA
jgi:pimeloyl-ACP methyl ester carboxylesterase